MMALSRLGIAPKANGRFLRSGVVIGLFLVGSGVADATLFTTTFFVGVIGLYSGYLMGPAVAPCFLSGRMDFGLTTLSSRDSPRLPSIRLISYCDGLSYAF
jgi:hypothetical protein